MLGAPLAASNEQLHGIANAADDFLAPAAYRVTVPNLPDKHVLTAYHVADTANTTENDSDAKRDLDRLDAKGDGTAVGGGVLGGLGVVPHHAGHHGGGHLVDTGVHLKTIVYNTYTGEVLGTAASTEEAQKMADEAAAKLPEGSPVSYQLATPEKGRYIFSGLATAEASLGTVAGITRPSLARWAAVVPSL